MKRVQRDAELTEFVEARQVQLRRIAYAICGDWHRAEDVLQVALAKLYAAWPRIRDAGAEEAYARRIIVNTDLDDRRRAWRRHEVADLTGRDGTISDGVSVEDRTALVEALQQLPTMQRRVVVLRHWLGLSIAETATELGIGEGTVKSHSSRALLRLRGVLTPLELVVE